MKINIKDIVSAWAIAANPTEEERILSEKRYQICSTCDQRGKNKIGIETCKACGCPLSKKIFTLNDEDSCPLKKWDEVNSEFRKEKKKRYFLF